MSNLICTPEVWLPFEAIVRDVIGHTEPIDLDCTVESIGVDSLDWLEILHGAEEKFDIDIPKGHKIAEPSFRSVTWRDTVGFINEIIRGKEPVYAEPPPGI